MRDHDSDDARRALGGLYYSRGFIDVIIHDLDADELRDIAPTIPFEMVQQVLFIGNSQELAVQFEAYARAGLEHVVLANITRVVGGSQLATPSSTGAVTALVAGFAEVAASASISAIASSRQAMKWRRESTAAATLVTPRWIVLL